MDARTLRTSLILISLLGSTGANYRTRNFVVTAPTTEIAKTVGVAAESYRRDLATFWLGQPLPNWSRPCKLRVKTGALGAGGETKFQFVGKEVVNWSMYVQGSLERILDSVLPHEVNHTIFACHFRRPLPRWADEGAATLFEHHSEQAKQLGLLNQVIRSDRELIKLDRLLTMKEYPKGYRPMLILYAEGYALADFLVQQGGQAKYLKFLADGERVGWTQAIKVNYDHGGVNALQKNWKGWILAGMPKLTDPREEMLAARVRIPNNVLKQGTARPAILDQLPAQNTIRSQSPSARPSAQPTSRTRPASHRTPAAKPPAITPRPARSASFEAPVPRPARVSTNEFTGKLIKRDSLESTSTLTSSKSPTETNRKHLPQKRNVVTGSIPQWAGFPGQSESF